MVVKHNLSGTITPALSIETYRLSDFFFQDQEDERVRLEKELSIIKNYNDQAKQRMKELKEEQLRFEHKEVSTLKQRKFFKGLPQNMQLPTTASPILWCLDSYEKYSGDICPSSYITE